MYTEEMASLVNIFWKLYRTDFGYVSDPVFLSLKLLPKDLSRKGKISQFVSTKNEWYQCLNATSGSFASKIEKSHFCLLNNYYAQLQGENRGLKFPLHFRLRFSFTTKNP